MVQRTISKIIYCGLLFSLSFHKLSAQVNLQTGSATFSVPMFNWQDNKSRLNSIVALNYNSGNGLRVNDVASSVGQGWNLLAGGVVTRMQVGEPDDQKGYAGDEAINGVEKYSDITRYPNGYLYDTATGGAAKGVPKALRRYPIFGWENQLYKEHNVVAQDRELDYFAFQFNGVSGQFILDKRTLSNNYGKGVSIGDNNLKITFHVNPALVNSGIRTTIDEFDIQDENGLVYRFKTLNITKILRLGYCESDLTEILNEPRRWGGVYHEMSVDKNDVKNPYVVSSWYLSEVEDVLTHRKIIFNYTTRNINSRAGVNITCQSGYSIITHHFSKSKTPVISQINYPDGHIVNFNYGKERVDLPGDYALSSVDVLYNGRYSSRYQLKTSYFILNRYGNPVTDYQKSIARLCLISVKQLGVDLKADNQPYIFDYYTGSGGYDVVPPLFFHLKDIWGFYNGDKSKPRYANTSNPIPFNKTIAEMDNNDFNGLCFQSGSDDNYLYLNPKTGYAKNGLLKQIIYPTGGAINYEYEQNAALLGSSYQEVGGVHVAATKVTDAGYSNGCDNPILTQYKYVDASGNSSMWGIEMPANHGEEAWSHYEAEDKYFEYKPVFNFNCTYDFKYPGLINREDKIDLTDAQKTMEILSDVMNVVSTVMNIIDIIKLISTGSGVGAVILDFIGILIDFIFSCFSDTAQDTATISYYNSDINGSNPLPVQFKRVEVVSGTGSIGKTIQEFTSSDDIPLWAGTGANPLHSMKQRFANWAYGLPKKTIVYDVNGYKVKETENIYDTTKVKRSPCATYSAYAGNNVTCISPIGMLTPLLSIPCSYISCKYLVTHSASQRYTDWDNKAMYDIPTEYITQSNEDINVEFYDIYTGRVQLSDTYERTFKPNNFSQYLESHTHFDYHLTNLQVAKITTTQSNGDINIKDIFYDVDNAVGVFNTMVTNNMVTVPYKTTESVINNGSTTVKYLAASETEFTQLSNGDIKPYRTLGYRLNIPATTLPTSVETQRFTYDASGNLTGMKDEGNHIVSNIYGYNDKYVIASVINADATADKAAYTGFEVQGELGGWSIITGYNTINTATSITGNACFTIDSKALSASGLNINKPYKLSFWATGTVTISGATSTLITSNSSIGINGFTYYEYSLPAATSAITLTGTGNIDELRLYPLTARMRTVNYDPLIGKIAECDENNRITYYEYDALGRLRFIKDEKKNVVKMYEYNTVSNKQGGCPGTYYNKLISEIFTKNNCGSGYVGTSVTYTIAAGAYSSTISQFEADAKAEDELNSLGQNYANTNGGCRLIYYNTARSQTFTKHSCPVGYVGGSVTYTVPAGKYMSIESQADADTKAQHEIDANGQAYANNNPGFTCTITTDPIWRTVGTPQYMCGSGSLASHQLVLVTDVNPNSSTYNQTQWADTGVNTTACPVSDCNGTCVQPGSKCINGACETGVKVYTSSIFYGGPTVEWECTYHYEWSDGSWSEDYTETQFGLAACTPNP
ncbi:MAG: hypothetical protein JST29_01470 [Bacteroidetes bacterium]|nr:hypothetical protein [Bacteroidota bacterium]